MHVNIFSACEQVVVRYFPVSTMTKEKQIKLGYTPHIDQLPKDGIQIRANIFQVRMYFGDLLLAWKWVWKIYIDIDVWFC